MFEKIKLKLRKEKRIIICIHGFGSRLSHEYDNFKLWYTKDSLITFDIYNIYDENDNNPDVWIKRCERKVEQYIKEGYRIDMIGFSMGGVIATHLASKYPIGRLFLIAPAFDYIHISNIMGYVVKKVNKPQEKLNKPKMPPGFTSCFMDVIKKCKDDIELVKCPICIVQGDKDEIIPLRSSINAYEKIHHDQKRLFVIHEGKHRMMMHQNSAWETYKLFEQFMNKEILPEEKIIYAKDIYSEFKY